MDVILFSFVLRGFGVLFGTTLAGIALWAIGSVLIASLWAGSHIAPLVNLVVTFGSAAAIMSWLVWRKETASWPEWFRRLPIALASGYLLAWVGANHFGHAFIWGGSVGGVNGIQGLPGIAPVTGAWMGGLLASIVPLGLFAVYRAFKFREM